MVLLFGESGIGKEVLVCGVYEVLLCKNECFVVINCVVILDNLLESEFFGYEKGVFIGVVKIILGKIESVNGGMLMFDEIGDLLYFLQVKFLCFFQEWVVEWVGGCQEILVDVCIVCVIYQNFKVLIKEGCFCEDFFYCFVEIVINIFFLGQCKGDVILFVYVFVCWFLVEQNCGSMIFIEDVVWVIEFYIWLGNVCELENCIKCVVIMVDGQ